jgi:hypothetical protein
MAAMSPQKKPTESPQKKPHESPKAAWRRALMEAFERLQ